MPMPLESGGAITVRLNSDLSDLELPELRFAESLHVVGNSMLPSCQAHALESQLVDFAGTVQIASNADAGTCP